MADPRPTPHRFDPRLVPIVEVVERPPAERPAPDSLDGVAEWLVGPARRIASGARAFDEFAWRMLATGLPLLRVTMHSGTLHPQYLGATFVWWRTTGQTVQTLIAHEVTAMIRPEENPVRRVVVGGETLRRRIDVADAVLDFPILHELKAEGATDYLALPLASARSPAMCSMPTWAPRPVSGCWRARSAVAPARRSAPCCGPRTCAPSPRA